MADCIMLGRKAATAANPEERTRNNAAVKEKRYICWLCDADCGSKAALLAHLYAHKIAIEQQVI